MLIEVVHYGLICDVTHSPLASISSNEHTAYGQLCTCSKVLAALLGACRVQYIFFFFSWWLASAGAGTTVCTFTRFQHSHHTICLSVCAFPLLKTWATGLSVTSVELDCARTLS